jgi:hypothetical protein
MGGDLKREAPPQGKFPPMQKGASFNLEAVKTNPGSDSSTNGQVRSPAALLVA